MNNIVPIGQAKMPAAMRERLNAGVAINKNLSDGIADSFPVLSVRGKVFRIRMSGTETPLIDQQTKQVIPFLDVVLVNGSPNLSKAYYISGFNDDAEFTQPDCWSLDSIKPDPSVPNKVNPTCPDCPMNVFGSAPSRDQAGGKRGGKACGDARRIAVMMPGHIGTEEPLVFLMRVPATSLKNLKAYAQLLSRQGWDPAGCVTRLAFDYQEAYPKLVFNFVDGLTDDEYAQVSEISESRYVSDMLRAPDFDMAESAKPAQTDTAGPRVRQQAPVMAEPEVKVAEKPAEETQHAANGDVWIDLPTGERYNQATGEIVKPEPEQAEPEPATDPNVIALPDGRFFNQKIGAFVDGPGAAAPQAEAPAKPKRVRPSRAKGKVEPEVPPKQEAQQDNQPAQGQTEVPPRPQSQAAQPEQKASTNGHGPAQERVKAAPAALDDIIRSVFPTKK